MDFWTDRFQNTWLVKCLKGPLSEDASTINMVNRLKHSSKLNGSTFTIFIDPCEGNSGWKSLFDWYAKSWNCLLAHWLPMTSILFLTEPIYCNIFRYNYLRNKKQYLIFLCIFRFNFKHFQKKMTLKEDVLLNLRTPQSVLRKMVKKSRFRGPFDK